MGLLPLQPVYRTTYIGITQACRMLRLEFCPLFWISFRCTVQNQQILAFLRDFHYSNGFKGVEYTLRLLGQGPAAGRPIRVLPLLRRLHVIVPGLWLVPPAIGCSRALQTTALLQFMASYAGNKIKSIRLMYLGTLATEHGYGRIHRAAMMHGVSNGAINRSGNVAVEIVLPEADDESEFFHMAAVVQAFSMLFEHRRDMGGCPPLIALNSNKKYVWQVQRGQTVRSYRKKVVSNRNQWWGWFEA
jgi:hypothetical protein